ncbi:uncharacterized protein [Watersipora subatra]|uniref:uncharacterized protein n=1 Tax=Watersipora subatra TaxID=2589382 RepID=UPI00355BAD5A
MSKQSHTSQKGFSIDLADTDGQPITCQHPWQEIPNTEPIIEYPPSEGQSSLGDLLEDGKQSTLPSLVSIAEDFSSITYADEAPENLMSFEEFIEINELVEINDIMEKYDLLIRPMPLENADADTTVPALTAMRYEVYNADNCMANDNSVEGNGYSSTYGVMAENLTSAADLVIETSGMQPSRPSTLQRKVDKLVHDSQGTAETESLLVNQNNTTNDIDLIWLEDGVGTSEETRLSTCHSPWSGEEGKSALPLLDTNNIHDTIYPSDDRKHFFAKPEDTYGLASHSSLASSSSTEGSYICFDSKAPTFAEASQDLTVPQCRLGPAPYRPPLHTVVGSVKFVPRVQLKQSAEKMYEAVPANLKQSSALPKWNWSSLDIRSAKSEIGSDTGSSATLVNGETSQAHVQTEQYLSATESDSESVGSNSSWRKVRNTRIIEKLRVINALKPMKLCFMDLVKRRNMQRWYPAPPLSPDTTATVVSATRKFTPERLFEKLQEMSSEDSLETAPFPSQVRTISKLNGSKTGPWVQQSKGHDVQAHPKFTRKESIVEQEIRLQREREKELNLERQMLTQAKLSTPFEELQPETRNRESLQVDALPAPSPIASSPAQSPAQSYALSSSPKPVATPKLTTQKSKGSMIYQLSNRTRSPSVEISDSKVTSPWYTSESPIARDIRTTKEREEALKVTRRQTSGPSLPGNKDD